MWRCLVLISFSIVFFTTTSVSQKKLIGLQECESWPSVTQAAISNDGRYASAILDYQNGFDTSVVLATQGDWKIKLAQAGYSLRFTSNSKFAVAKSGDSLCIITLGKKSIEIVTDVNSFKVPEEGQGSWIAYHLKNKGIVIRDLSNGKQQVFPNGLEYIFNKEGTVFLSLNEINQPDSKEITLVDLLQKKSAVIWNGIKAVNYVFSKDGSRLAFIGEKLSKNVDKSIFYYQVGDTYSSVLLKEDTLGKIHNLKIQRIVGFNADGSSLFMGLIKNEISKESTIDVNTAKLNVWSYKDAKLQSHQLAELNKLEDKSRMFLLQRKNRRLIQLEYANEEIISSDILFTDYPGKVALILKRGPGDCDNEWNWNKQALTSVYTVSLEDGKRNLWMENIPVIIARLLKLSPSGRYVVYFDTKRGQYFCHVLETGVDYCISNDVKSTWINYRWKDVPTAPYYTSGILGWLNDDRGILVYNMHDLFLMDLAGKQGAVNITNEYGARNNIEFSFPYNKKNIIDIKEPLLLSAYDFAKKNNGFFKINLKEFGVEPTLLNMQPCRFTGSRSSEEFGFDPVIKARNAEVYIVKKQNANESPNYFITNDFKIFKPLTSLYPEKSYNWMNSELVVWRSFDNKLCEGILYKPENFDSTKKYPIIFYYYERYSDGAHVYLAPNYSSGRLEIPYYVSNGYLVFIPDIHYEIGYPGKSAYNSIVSAAQYLDSKPWVDSLRMGLQGHSFGGFETNYIVAHTNIFAAACSAAGMSNFISAYGSIPDGTSRQRQYELYRDRMGTSLWDAQQLYIENSPVLKANKITTPMLLIHNENDEDVPYSQDIEFFTGLRRLGKKAWLLQYDNEGHVLRDIKAKKDLTIRMKQFFDYYLKSLKPPKWMTQGISRSMKGVESGLTLDETNSVP